MTNGTGRNVYLIRQHTDRPGGEYLVRAVVIASGPGRAVKGLLRHVRTHHPAASARRGRLTVVRIGENAPERIDPFETVHAGDEATIVATVLGEDATGRVGQRHPEESGNPPPHPIPAARSKEMHQQPYQVAWEIDLDAATPEAAARQALALLRDSDPGSLAHVFTVTDESGNTRTVDLDAASATG